MIAASDNLKVFLLMALVLFVFFLPSLNYPFSMDPIHLIRPYSGHELLSAWSGHWDPDNIETAGWRPITTLFYFIQWFLFRSSALLQRLSLIFLMALVFTMFYNLFVRLTGNKSCSLGACLVSATSMSTFYHATFLSDGIHFFLLFFLLLAAKYFLDFSESGKIKNGLIFLVLFSIALLTREETIGWTLALPLLGWIYLAGPSPEQRRNIFRIFLISIVIMAGYFILRTIILSKIDYHAGVLLHPRGCTDKYPDLIRGLGSAFQPFDICGEWISRTLIVMVLIIGFIRADSNHRWRLGLLIGVIFLTLLHTAIYYRSKLIYSAVPFVALAFCWAFWLSFNSRTGRWMIVILFCLAGIFSSYRRQITFHPRALTSLQWDLEVQEGLNQGAHADPRVRKNLYQRLAKFDLIDNNLIPRHQQLEETSPALRRIRIVSWPWEIPEEEIFRPAYATWW